MLGEWILCQIKTNKSKISATEEMWEICFVFDELHTTILRWIAQMVLLDVDQEMGFNTVEILGI